MTVPTVETGPAVAAVDCAASTVGAVPGQSLRAPPVPTAGPETQSEVTEGLLGRQRLAVTHSRGNNTNRWDPRKILLLLLLPYILFCRSFSHNYHCLAETVKVLVIQSCPTLCDLMDYSPPGSSVHGILQTRTLEWVPFSFQAHLPDPGIEPGSPALQADSLLSEPLREPYLLKFFFNF